MSSEAKDDQKEGNEHATAADAAARREGGRHKDEREARHVAIVERKEQFVPATSPSLGRVGADSKVAPGQAIRHALHPRRDVGAVLI